MGFNGIHGGLMGSNIDSVDHTLWVFSWDMGNNIWKLYGDLWEIFDV